MLEIQRFISPSQRIRSEPATKPAPGPAQAIRGSTLVGIEPSNGLRRCRPNTLRGLKKHCLIEIFIITEGHF